MKILTTLAENDYFLGVAALLNSVIKNGTYVDKVIIGYRGDLPSWLPELIKSKNGHTFDLGENLVVELVEVVGALHMVHEKPKWFEHLTFNLEPHASEYYFYDSDITVLNRMDFFGEWSAQGVGICEDVNYDMSSNHPIRLQWKMLAEKNGLKIERELSRYYNSGFLAWRNEHIQFIRDWVTCFDLMKSQSGDMKQFRVNDRTKMILSANQDSFNLAAMITKVPISVIGPEAMGFHYGLKLMAHPLGPKPWNINFIKAFFQGNPPRNADLSFWKYACGALNPYTATKVKSKINQLKLLKGLGRFYSK